MQAAGCAGAVGGDGVAVPARATLSNKRVLLCGAAAPLRRPRAPPARRRAVTVRAQAGSPGGGREPWSLRRFVDTVLFFNAPQLDKDKPLLAAVADSLLSAARGAGATPGVIRLDGSPAPPPPTADVVLVAGATGGVGRRVVEKLLAAGRPVRALVRDRAAALRALRAADAAHPGRLSLVLADITQPATLQPAYLRGVSALVCATAVRVQPKEGDTADRAKYRQGIKFYDPEIVGDTPETVEYRGVANLLAWARHRLGAPDGETLFDAAAPATGPAWGDLSDPVMGGVSESSFALDRAGGEGGAPTAVFSGVVSTANNGGFASVRTRNFDPPLDLSHAAGITLRLRGDGQRYKFFIRTDPGWDAVAYALSFDTAPGEWQMVRLPFAAFRAIFRARTLADAPPLDASRVVSLQLMLSKFEYDGDLNPSFAGAGAFALPVSRIATFPDERAAAAPRWVHVSSAGVTRPNRPGIDVNAEPPAVRLNDELGGLLTWKLAGEDAVRDSGVPYAIVRPAALTEEPAGAPLVVEQGDRLKGKVSRDDVAELCAWCVAGGAAAAAALNRTFEVKSTLPFAEPWAGGAAAPRDWRALLAATRPGVTGRTIDGVYTADSTEEEALASLTAAASGGLAS